MQVKEGQTNSLRLAQTSMGLNLYSLHLHFRHHKHNVIVNVDMDVNATLRVNRA